MVEDAEVGAQKRGWRLQRFLSQAGVASRRHAERLIESGRVRVNGEIVTELGVRVDPQADHVEVDGRDVHPAERTWIALHKPSGYLSARWDTHGRPTIYALLPESLRRLFHVGRLDFESEGLLLLSNDGAVANRLLHPRHAVERVYVAHVQGAPDEAIVKALSHGVPLEDGVARVIGARILAPAESGAARLELTLAEGRKREVRRMLEAVGHPVLRLIRTRYGPVTLDGLALGQWRLLSDAEVGALEGAVANSDR